MFVLAMKVHRGVEVQLKAFLTATLGPEEWPARLPGCFVRGAAAGVIPQSLQLQTQVKLASLG
jgi:hypothetical protein